MPRSTPVIFLLLLFAGCHSSNTPMPAPDYAALRSGWASDLQSHNLDSTLARYSPDAVFTNPDGSRADSPAALRTLFSNAFTMYDAHISLTPIKTIQSPTTNVAYESGTYTEDLTLRSDHTTRHIAGDYLTLYRRSPDGHWLILRQSWTDTPNPTPLDPSTATPAPPNAESSTRP